MALCFHGPDECVVSSAWVADVGRVLAVAFSRVALGADYLTDVVGAMALGTAWVILSRGVMGASLAGRGVRTAFAGTVTKSDNRKTKDERQKTKDERRKTQTDGCRCLGAPFARLGRLSFGAWYAG